MASPAPLVVLGQGALGTLVAAVAASGSQPTQVVSRRVDEPETVRLSARGRGWAREADVELVPKPPDRVRSIVVATRADEALDRARAAAPALTDEGVIVPLQNGLVGLELADELGHERVAPAVVGFNAQLRDARTVEVTSPGEITVGALDPGARPGVEAFVRALERPVGARPTPNPRGAVWSKWCVSCAINGLAVATGAGVSPVTRRREGREALVGVLTEATRVADAEGVELERVAGPLSPDALAGNGSRGLGGAFRRGLVWLIGRRYRDVTPSAVRALEEGRDPELDALNREAVRRGAQAGLPMPWNEATLALADAVAAGEREPTMANLDEIRDRARA